MSLLDTASLIVTPNGYKEGKLYSVIPSDGSGDMSVVRATTATRVNSAGLVELVPYNLWTYSENFSNAAWGKSGATFSVDTLTGNAGTSFKGIFQNQTTQGVQSVFFDVAYSSHQWIQIGVGTGATDFGYVNFDIQNKVVGAQASGFTGSIVDFGTYVRIIANMNTIDKTSVFLCLVNSSSSSRADSTTSTGSIKLYRSQLNEGALKDYQKTETRLNIPRLDYSNGTCPSLLVEPQRTNLAQYSSSFDNAVWNKSNTTISANSAISPSGINDANSLVPNTTNAAHFIENSNYLNLSIGQTYTTSFYAKANGYNFIQFTADGGDISGNPRVNFNLSNGTLGSVDAGITASIQDVGNGWYRCVATYVADYNVFNNIICVINSSTAARAEAFIGNGTSGILIWGAQLELGSYSTSYIPTTSASVTRNADVISKTGISSLIGQTEGTIFCEINFDINVNTTGSSRIQLSDGTTTNWIFIGIPDGLSGNLIRMFCNSPSGTMSEFTSSPIANGVNKIAFAYKSGSFVLYVNGIQAAASSSSITIPTCSRIDLQGQTPNQAAFERINYKAAALWKTRLTNTQLAQLTTI